MTLHCTCPALPAPVNERCPLHGSRRVASRRNDYPSDAEIRAAVEAMTPEPDPVVLTHRLRRHSRIAVNNYRSRRAGGPVQRQTAPGPRWAWLPVWMQRACFYVLLWLPDGPRWPLWWTRAQEWIAIRTTPRDGF